MYEKYVSIYLCILTWETDTNFLFTVIELHEYKVDYIQQYQFWLTKVYPNQ